MIRKITLAILCLGVLVVLAGAMATDDAVDKHDNEKQDSQCDCPDCAEEGHEAEVVDAHAGHDHEAEAAVADDEHEDEIVIELDSHEIENIGLLTAKAGKGTIADTVTLTGQIKVNEDKLAHIVPQVSGVVREVNKKVGDPVAKGEIIAWMDSSELGQTKIDYLDALGEIGCCTIVLTRAENISKNASKLLELLKSEPPLEKLRQLNTLEMGDVRSKLIGAYAEYTLAQSNFKREKSLYDQAITSQQEYLASQSELKKARALYTAAADTVEFQIKSDLLEAKRAQQQQELALKGAERKLYIMGLGKADLDSLNAISQGKTPIIHVEIECDDPNCEACQQRAAQAQTASGDENLSRYALRAPFDGVVIEKHITLGERLDGTSNAFVIADLDTVWVDMDIYQKDLLKIKKGQRATIEAGKYMPKAEGVISYVSGVVDSATRTATARVVLANDKGIYRPGLFVTAHAVSGMQQSDVVISSEAVVTLEGKSHVFIKDAHGFEPREVVLGQSDRGLVEIVSGLSSGEEYVSKGAFELKSKVVTSTLDSHAGHGH